MFEDYEDPFLECGLGKLVKKKVQTRLESKVLSLEILIFLIWTNVPRTNVALTVHTALEHNPRMSKGS